MKITIAQMLDFVYRLPTNMDYPSPEYGRISIDQDYMVDKLTEWFTLLGIEVDMT